MTPECCMLRRQIPFISFMFAEREVQKMTRSAAISVPESPTFVIDTHGQANK